MHLIPNNLSISDLMIDPLWYHMCLWAVREIYTWRVWSCCVWLEWIMWQSLQELIPLDVSNYPQNSNSGFAEETLQNDCDSCFYLAGVTFYTYWWGEIIRTDVNIRWNMALRAQRNSTGLLRTRFSSSEESCWPQSLHRDRALPEVGFPYQNIEKYRFALPGLLLSLSDDVS